MQTPDELLSQLDEQEKQDAAVSSGDIPAITKISIDVTGTRNKHYQGEFVYKVPTLGDQIQVGRLKNTYLPQGGGADVNAAILVEQICYLAVTLQDPKPEWWDPFAMYDAAPIGTLYGEALTYERRFHGEAQDREAATSGAAGADAQQGSGPSAPSETSVGRKVQPPAKRRETLASHSTRSG